MGKPKAAAAPTLPGPHDLPAGVRLLDLRSHSDDRGAFTEVFRRSWDTGIDPVQWNLVRSEAGVLRGVHVHVRHTDYLIVASGEASVGLRDLRSGSGTDGLAAVVEMSGADPAALTIPPGVAHGFLFREPSLHLYAVSRYWDPEDELACHWDDPDLGIDWPAAPSSLSERDAAAGSLAELLTAARL